jgi:Tol biopolymer transport system component
VRRIASLVVLSVWAGFVLTSCGGGGSPRPDLLFVSTRDGDYAIYEMNADGSRQQRLTKTDVDTTSPTGLFFQVDPAWSPNGASIAFASKRSGTSEIYVMRADGSGTRQLTTTRADDLHPTWSPDGKRIAFGSGDTISVMSADGSAPHAVSSGRLADDAAPAWSPDGRWIAFVRRQRGDVEREIWVMRPDGTDVRRLTSLHGSSINPAWSPDSTRIVFASNIVGSLYDLYTVTLSDGRIRRLTRSGPDTIEPAWSPDGSTIAFSQDGAIATVDLQGKTTTLTSSENNDSSPAWNPVEPPGGN